MDHSLLLEKSFCSATGSVAWEGLGRVGLSAAMSVSAGGKWVLAAGFLGAPRPMHVTWASGCRELECVGATPTPDPTALLV